MDNITFERPAKKKGAPPCGLYIKIGARQKIDHSFAALLHKVCFTLNNGSYYEKNMHILEYAPPSDTSKTHELIEALKDQLQSQGMVFIVRDNIDLAQAINADGVIVKSQKAYEKACKQLGKDFIVGLKLSQPTKKSLQWAIDQKCDFISLPLTTKNHSAITHLAGMWSTATTNPCLIEGKIITNNNCKPLVQAGASFIEASDYVWKYDQGVDQAIMNMLYAIELALDDIVKH